LSSIEIDEKHENPVFFEIRGARFKTAACEESELLQNREVEVGRAEQV
jgi:hypothetical protein